MQFQHSTESTGRLQLFEQSYDTTQSRDLSAYLGELNHPQSAVTLEDIQRDYPHYQKLLVDDPALLPFVHRYLDGLQPYLQCPFPLPGGTIIQGAWPGAYKIGHFDRCDITAETVAGKRVLDIGCNAGFDTFYLATLQPREIVGIEPTALFFYQALFLWSLYQCPQLSFRQMGWQQLAQADLGTFDIVNCQGILYHERHPLLLLEALRDALTPGGTLILETHVLMTEEKVAHFVEDAFWGDPTWWWVPSINALSGMLRSCGFRDVTIRMAYPVESKNEENAQVTTEGEPAGGRATLTAIRA